MKLIHVIFALAVSTVIGLVAFVGVVINMTNTLPNMVCLATVVVCGALLAVDLSFRDRLERYFGIDRASLVISPRDKNQFIPLINEKLALYADEWERAIREEESFLKGKGELSPFLRSSYADAEELVQRYYLARYEAKRHFKEALATARYYGFKVVASDEDGKFAGIPNPGTW